MIEDIESERVSENYPSRRFVNSRVILLNIVQIAHAQVSLSPLWFNRNVLHGGAAQLVPSLGKGGSAYETHFFGSCASRDDGNDAGPSGTGPSSVHNFTRGYCRLRRECLRAARR